MRGHSVNYLKLDPYLQINAGNLSPVTHGECFITNDGKESDLDLGHIERLVNIETSDRNIWTSGALYKELIDDQDRYLGKSLQVVPHLTDLIIEKMSAFNEELIFVEIGGTVGDIESGHFYEAIRQLKQSKPDDVLVAMVAPILWVPTIQEFKTKPLQNAVRTLQQFGIHPDMLICRSNNTPKGLLDKISGLVGVARSNIFDAPDVDNIYEVPLELYDRQVDDLIVDKFRLKRNACKINKYKELVKKDKSEFKTIRVGIVAKYDNCVEAYISLKEALLHAGVANNVKIYIMWINAEDLEKHSDIATYFQNIDCIVVPGGFDIRGTLGKIKAIEYVRENKMPFLGICLGLQCAVIEFARNVCKMETANSTEFDPDTDSPVVHFIPGQENIKQKCGTMRLGAYDCELKKNSLAYELYKKKVISERHRHRYEVNDQYIEQYESHGFKVSGRHPEVGLVEIMELDRDIHPYFICTQAHPEFKSRLSEPSPLFSGLIAAAINSKESS